MRRVTFCLLIILLQTLTLSGQQKYADIQLYEKSSVFNDQFDNNSKKWITDNSWINGRVENGYYFLKCKNFQGATGLSYKTVQLDQGRDFEIEATLEAIKGSGGLLFGMNETFDHYRVDITDKNDLVVVKNIPAKNRNKELYSVSNSSLLESGSPVKITIRKLNDIYYIFINESLVREFNNINPEGNQIGFNVGRDSEIIADYLDVCYLTKHTSPLLVEENLTDRDTAKLISKNNIVITETQNNTKVLVKASAPEITWISPSADSTSLDLYTARVKAGIKSVSDLKSVHVYVNGASRGEGELRLLPGENGSYIVEKTITFKPDNNSVYFVATNYEGAIRSDLRYFRNPSATLPVISWGNPVNTNSIVNSDRIRIEVCINSPSGLNSARILVNGEDRGGDNVFQPSGYGDCDIEWQKSVVLKEGDNSIYVMATNSAGIITSERRLIKFLPALAEKRIALIVGNSEYISGTDLKNPANDANLMEATLKELGFDVIKRLNSGRDLMLNSIRDFSRKLSEYNVALFYYAGHGIQVDGVNYLIPTDAELKVKEDCKWEAVAVNTVTEEFNRYKTNTNIVILDACRNNPYRSWVRGEEAGFRALAPVIGTIISFATSEGASAADGTGANGLFTEELVKQMLIPQQIESVFKNTRRMVMERSNNQQTPVEWSYLTGEFYFKR
ncbi:MAG: caspase family protein [Bacteroidales bacterium]|nr:caspase family protein [Bacteroidales bacterium]